MPTPRHQPVIPIIGIANIINSGKSNWALQNLVHASEPAEEEFQLWFPKQV